MVEHTGGCLCGAVRFKVEADPIGVRACWCTGCQRLGAGSGTVGAVFPSAAVKVTGQPTDFPMTADSGEKMHRSFCGTCGTPLFSDAESRPHVRIIRVGALDHPENFPPTGIIWAKSAPPWACLDPALPKTDGQPPPPPKP